MSIRQVPPPAPCHPRRANQLQFAQIEYRERNFEVQLRHLGVGGAAVEFVGLPPPESCLGSQIHLFVDVGPDLEGERVAGTLAAHITWLEKAKDGVTAVGVVWAGRDPGAVRLVDRLLTQQIAGEWERKLAA